MLEVSTRQPRCFGPLARLTLHGTLKPIALFNRDMYFLQMVLVLGVCNLMPGREWGQCQGWYHEGGPRDGLVFSVSECFLTCVHLSSREDQISCQSRAVSCRPGTLSASTEESACLFTTIPAKISQDYCYAPVRPPPVYHTWLAGRDVDTSLARYYQVSLLPLVRWLPLSAHPQLQLAFTLSHPITSPQSTNKS